MSAPPKPDDDVPDPLEQVVIDHPLDQFLSPGNAPKTDPTDDHFVFGRETPKDDQFIGSTTKWWLGTILLPPIFCGLGIGVALNVHVAQGDMIGVLPLLCIVGGATIGYLLSLICTVVSVKKGEGWSGLAIVFSIGYTILLYRAWFG